MAVDKEKAQLILDILESKKTDESATLAEKKQKEPSKKEVAKELVLRKIKELYQATQDFYGSENTDFHTLFNRAKSAEPNEKLVAYLDAIGDDVFGQAIKVSAHPNNRDAIKFDRGSAYYVTSLSGFLFEIIIKIPEIEVLSEDGNRHKMVECYLELRFLKDLRLSSATFYRGRRSVIEFDSNYLFSHCHKTSTQGPGGQGFCFGTNTSMSTLFAAITNDSYLEDDTLMFIYSMKNYLAYESVSGTPYMRLTEIRMRSSSNSSTPNISEAELKLLYKSFIAGGNKFDIIFNPSGDAIVNNSPTLWREVSKYTPSQYLLEYDETRNCTLNPNGGAADMRRLTERYNEVASQSVLFNFKDQPIKEVVFNPNEEGPKKEKVCKDSIRDYVIAKLNRELNEYIEQRFQQYSY